MKVYQEDVKVGEGINGILLKGTDMYGKDEQIMVCVQMCVYNHGRYLRKAIEGVLMQKTNFRYELLIAEDCSTDNSREIVIEYQKKFPNIIRALLNPVNIGAEENGRQIYEASRGKYVAICEGDDYWTDPYKLQKQVDFLESHPEYSGCYHSVKIVDENDNSRDIGQTPYIYHEDSDYGIEEWKKCILPGQSCSIVMKNIYSTMPRDEYDVMIKAKCTGDNKIPIILLHYGKIRKMSKEMSCYRRSYTGDSWNARTVNRDMRAFWYVNAMEREHLAIHCLDLSFLPHNESRGNLLSIIGDVRAGKEEAGKLLQEVAAYNPWQLVAFLLTYDLQRLNEWERPLIADFSMESNLVGTYVIFGTGVYGEKCYLMLKSLGISDKILMFWDNDGKKQGNKKHGIMIGKPTAGLNEDCRILISSKKYETEMRNQLRELGYMDRQMPSAKEMLKKSINKMFCIGRYVL